MQLGKCWNPSYFWCLSPGSSHSLCCGCPGVPLTAGTPVPAGLDQIPQIPELRMPGSAPNSWNTCFPFTPLQHTSLAGLPTGMVLKSLLWVVQTDLLQAMFLLPKSAVRLCLQQCTFCCSVLMSPCLPLGFQGSVESCLVVFQLNCCVI